MRPISSFIGFLCLFISSASASGNPPQFTPSENINQVFVENKGQVADMAGNKRPDVLFTTRSGQATLYFTAGAVYYVFPKYEKIEKPDNGADMAGGPGYRVTEVYRMDMQWVGANPGVQVVAEDKAESYSNYYYAQCPEGVEKVRHFGKLIYRNIYDRIDLVFYMHPEGGLKYDFIVHPGGDLDRIKVKYIGADEITELSNGALEVRNPLGILREEPVYAYQKNDDGSQKEVKGYYVNAGTVREGIVSYLVGEYDLTKPLVIDPLQRSYATFFGGNLDDYFFGSEADDDNIYMTFYTGSTNLPTTTGAYQTSVTGGGDSYVAKFSTSGSLVWGTYYGGSNPEQGQAVTVDKNGNVYNAGITTSSNFPVTSGAFQSTYSSGQDAYLLKLSSSGTRQWATFFGGTADDIVARIVTDTADEVYILGYTMSSNLPVSSGAFQTSIGSSTYRDAFLAKFSASGSRKWATYIGGNNVELGYGLAIDTSNNVWVGGQTQSTNFPVTSGTYQSSLSGSGDAFFGKFSPSGSRLWLSYYGGSGEEMLRRLCAHGGYISFSGYTYSSNFPVTSGSPSYGGSGDAFVTEFNLSGSRQFSSYYGGSGYDESSGIGMDISGNIYLSGFTGSSNFPITSGAYQTSNKGGNDAFIAVFSSGSAAYSSYYGGSYDDLAYSVELNKSGVFLLGSTQSNDFPITSSAYQSTRAAYRDCFIVRFIEQQDTPTIAAKSLKLSVNGCSSALVNWVKGNGAYRLVIAREGKAPDKMPGNKPYKANAVFGKGDDLGNGNYAMYSDTGGKFTAIGLIPDKTYYFTVYEFNAGISDAYYLKKNNPLDSIKIPSIKADFTLPDSNFCLGDIVDITNTSTVTAGTLTYTWYFGDGTMSTTISPAVKYSSTGTFNIKLRVVSDKGCVDSMVRKVNINPVPKAAFAVNSTPQCFKEHQFTFTDQTTIASGTLSYAWDFGDGSGSTVKNPSHTYASPGNYDVKLVVKSGAGCADSIIKRVIANPVPAAGFSINAAAQCLKDNDFVFTDNSSISSGILTYVWDFGDGAASTIQNPSHKYTATGNFKIKLTVKSDRGCADTLSKTVTVHPQPSVGFGINKQAQCLDGNSFVFIDTSSVSAGALSYLWDFGDGNASTQQNPTHIYTNMGTYNVSLSVTTSNGCQESVAKQVTVFPAVKAVFSTGNTCMYEPVVFTNASSGSIMKYTWDFGDSSFSNAKNPKHSYSASGSYIVSLMVISANGCADIRTQQITIYDPSAAFTTSKLTDSSYTFTPVSKDLKSWSWDFGDGQSSTDSTPTHIFRAAGQYLVKFTAGSAGGCKDSSMQLIIIKQSGIFEAGRDKNQFSVYPNPFNERLNISYTLTNQSFVNLDLMDMLGRKVASVADNQLQAAGEHEFSIGKTSISASPGLLFVRLTVDGQSFIKKVVFTK
jgi:PKD repeat protein